MRLDTATCRDRLESARFAVLGTTNEDGTPHLVPVVFAVDGTDVLLPVDTVKPKRTTRLARISNLERNPMATLLLDGRSEDWEDLWWVRADVRYLGPAPLADAEPLRRKYPRYAEGAAIADLVRLRIERVKGWAAQ